MNASLYPDKPGWQDFQNKFTFKEWNTRACKIANGLKKLGVGHQDRFAVMSYNRGEWMDIYAGCAKGGQIVVPLMFRHNPVNVEFIVTHSDCKAFIVEEPLVGLINSVKERLNIDDGNYIYLGDGPAPEGFVEFEEWLESSSQEEPAEEIKPSDIWTFMYTSGTTGRPKGVVKTHESYMNEYYLDIANMGVKPVDKCMLVMPMCHVNSIFYSFPYTLVSAPVFIYNIKSFDPLEMLKTISEYKITFTSLVPTHYKMILELPEDVRNNIDVSHVRQLLISSAPAQKSLKLDIMKYFKNAELWEAYGTTEGGLVTLLRPEDQLKKIGSIGKEIFGIDQIKLLDKEGNPVTDGKVGELWYRTPMIFKEYWGEPEKTKNAFKNGWSTAGDMAKKDSEGFYQLVDRKENMIITGGENVYPHEVEEGIADHPSIEEKAVIGIPDEKWGESIMAVVVLKDGYEPSDKLADEIINHCRKKIPSFMKPKKIEFISDEEMPRNATGKILHRVLREKYGKWSDHK